MDNKDKILKLFLDSEYVPMKFKELAFIMQVSKGNEEELSKLLNELEEYGKIIRTNKGRYALPDIKGYFSGRFIGHEKGYGFIESDNVKESIFVPAHLINGAMNGDIVLANIIKEKTNDKRAECEIVKITKRANEVVVGRFEYNKNFGFVIADDKRIPFDIHISKDRFFNARNNDKVLVKILKYPENKSKAEGEIIEILGNMRDMGIDILSVVKTYNIPYEFSEEILKEAQSISQTIDETNIIDRIDLRNKEIFTIDGEDAKDLDDAVCVDINENGNYLLGVHIADVSHYVRENTNLDKEAMSRGTSVYLVDRVVPMLPKELSNGICSLNEGKDRFTLSINIEINSKGEIISHDVYKGIINVTKRMTYTDVSKILIDKDEETCKKYVNYIEHFKRMEELALIIRKRRKEKGSLDLDIPEAKIIVNEKGKAIDVKKYDITIANNVIEEFMLTANETIAEKFFWLDAPFIYRIHEEPAKEKVEELNKFLYNLGYRIKGSNGVQPKAFQEVLEKVKGKDEERIISNLVLRTLKLAKYSKLNEGHFGLASKYYCHFTSPIRRYPDLFIHRIISKYIDENYALLQNEHEKYSKQAAEYAEISSEREKVAEKAERDADDIKKAEYMETKIGEEFDAIISSVTSFGFFVQLGNTVEGLVKFEYLDNDYYIYDEEHKYLIGERTKKIYRVGDKLKVKLVAASSLLKKIDFALVNLKN